MIHRWAVLISIFTVVIVASCGPAEQEGSYPAAAPEATLQDTDSGATTMAGDAAAGKELYAATCAACHGPEGEGVVGLGKDMTVSTFIAERTDAELVAFLKEGRGPDDPLNTTGVAMPPKGGNPALTDAQLADIVAHVRELQR